MSGEAIAVTATPPIERERIQLGNEYQIAAGYRDNMIQL